MILIFIRCIEMYVQNVLKKRNKNLRIFQRDSKFKKMFSIKVVRFKESIYTCFISLISSDVTKVRIRASINFLN